MKNKIIVFVGRGTSELKEQLKDYMCVREFKYERGAGDSCLSESDFILYCLGRRYEGGFIDEVTVERDNGNCEPIFFDDFLAKIDEAVDVKPCFKDLLSLGLDVFYFSKHKSSVERIRLMGFPVEVYVKDDFAE